MYRVCAYLNGTVPLAYDLQLYSLSALVQDNISILEWNDCSGLSLAAVFRRVGQGEDGIVRYGQETAIEGLFEIAVVGADRMVNSDKISTRRKGSFDLEFGKGVDYGRKDVTTTEQCLAQRHEICHRVVAITDKLSMRVTWTVLRDRGKSEVTDFLENICNQSLG